MERGSLGGCSNAMVLILNIALFVGSLQLIHVWSMTSVKDAACSTLYLRSYLAVGASLFVVSLLGIVGAGFRVPSVLWLYMAVSFFVILGFSCYIAYLFMAVQKGNGGGGDPLGDYSGLMQRAVNGGGWESIQNCLIESQLCVEPLETPTMQSRYYNKAIAPLKIGCCEKPKACTQENQHGDCTRWGDDPQVLCLTCDSCKAAMLSNFLIEWKFLAENFPYLLSFLCLVHIFGYCALANIRQDNYNQYSQKFGHSGYTNVVVRS